MFSCDGLTDIEHLDAATFKQTGSGDTSYVIGGGAFKAEDKVFQHNGAGTLSISNFYVGLFFPH